MSVCGDYYSKYFNVGFDFGFGFGNGLEKSRVNKNGKWIKKSESISTVSVFNIKIYLCF